MRRGAATLLFCWVGLVTVPWSATAMDQREVTASDKSSSGLFRAGAAAVDIGPAQFPVVVNGGFLAASAAKLEDPIRARCLVLDDGTTRLAIVVVDSCMMPRELIDRAKAMARATTGIPTERMLVSATHTHSAPSVMGALGTPSDTRYAESLPARIAAAIDQAASNLEPARVGWGAVDDPDDTHCRRWIRRPDRMLEDPFGRRNVRANMHPGYQSPDAIIPAGPVDPGLTVLSVQSRSGRPIAVLASYAVHYYGANPVSADYYGRFADALARRIGVAAGSGPVQDSSRPPFVAIMAQGTSGDQMWMDYGRPRRDPGLDAYADSVARAAERAYRSIPYRDHAELTMAETTLVLGRRLPDAARLAWANQVVAGMKSQGRDLPRTLPEVYAREAILLHDEPRRELKLQAIRVGELGIAAIPDEVYAITGLKIKAMSPLATTMNIELANGSEGYIPPPEQHTLGGYTTWPARTAGLEVQAEPKIVAAVLQLLERVAGRPRRTQEVPRTLYADAVLASRPSCYWRLDDMTGPIAVDSSGHGRDAAHEGGFALYLPGAEAPGFKPGARINRAAYLAGGWLRAPLDRLPEAHTVECWFWDGMPDGTRSAIGGLASRGSLHVAPRAWHHLAWVSAPRGLIVYLDGEPVIDLDGDFPGDARRGLAWLALGRRAESRSGDDSGFDGLVDEVAIYERALDAAEVAAHVRAARGR